ncbi:hypothetical protein CC78DRAFT_572677 [Lojkania enalia]|uniref:Uncharacterized protein n=1 Tax=Lojkania enalia TaxID=147567 RepID=A0A9P4N0Z2_9PLEO|nr:hypothetical protein CC78DRAFT_572677 [Didymosphaeria enalia]
MPLYQRRRPAPILISPRQDTTVPESSPDSPDSVGTTPGPDSPDSPDSPSPTDAAFEEDEEEDESEVPSSPEPSTALETGSNPLVPIVTSQPISSVMQTLLPDTSTPPSFQQITVLPTTFSGPTPTNIAAADPDDNSSQKAISTQPTTTSSLGGAIVGQDPAQKSEQGGREGGMSKGAEAALVTLVVLGVVALIVGAVILLRRRRRRQVPTNQEAEDAFNNPPNTSDLRPPEAAYDSHLTRSTTTTGLLGGSDPLYRPGTVSTDSSPPQSRITPPQPTPNPFADPPLNKAYDVLRGRPRSTTLTDRGSWIENPFRDPASDRFDPFGELQEKARQERIKYMEELRREQELLEKERDQLGEKGR